MFLDLVQEFFAKFGLNPKEFLYIALLFFAWLLLKRETDRLLKIVDRMAETIDTLRSEIIAVQDSVDQAPISNGDSDSDIDPKQHWYLIRDQWSDTKARIQFAIDKINKKNVRKKYSKFSRYNYEEIIQTLYKDKEISNEIHLQLLNMNKLFLKYRSQPQNVSAKNEQEFLKYFNSIADVLPRRNNSGE